MAEADGRGCGYGCRCGSVEHGTGSLPLLGQFALEPVEDLRGGLRLLDDPVGVLRRGREPLGRRRVAETEALELEQLAARVIRRVRRGDTLELLEGAGSEALLLERLHVLRERLTGLARERLAPALELRRLHVPRARGDEALLRVAVHVDPRRALFA